MLPGVIQDVWGAGEKESIGLGKISWPNITECLD